MLTENNGYVKLFRKIIDDEWYQDSNTIRLYIHCLLRANYKDGKWQGIKYEQGEFVTSHKSLANELGLSVQNIRTSLKKLILTDKLTSKTTNKYTIIKVVNWLKYYFYDNETNKQTNKQPNNPLTFNQQTTNKQLTTDKKDNKEKKEKNDKDIIHKHGEYSHVLLTEKQFESLKTDFPNDYENMIKNLDEYLETKNVSYKNHSLVMRKWKAKDKKQTNKPKDVEVDWLDKYLEDLEKE